MSREEDFRLLRLLVATQFGEEPETVDGLVRKLGVSQSFVSQRLRRLQKEGYLDRRTVATPTGRVVHYIPRPAVHVEWISPDERVAVRWMAKTEIDWRFPLLSQIPDLAAQQTVLALLLRLQEQGLLFPGDLGKRGEPVPHLGLSLVVYGSTARGTARPGSDVDLLSIQDEAKKTVDVQEVVESACADVSLAAPRPIQVKHLLVDDVVVLPKGVQTSIKQDGLIVFDGLRAKRRGPSRRLWEFVYGGRDTANL